MRFAASRRKHARIYAHGNTRWQQSCSRSNAICNHRFKTRTELRIQEQPLVAEHRGGTHSRMKRPQPQPPHTRRTFHRRPKPLYTEKHKVSCSGFPPSSPLLFVTTSLPHHFPSSPPYVIACSCFVMCCYVMYGLTPPFYVIAYYCYVMYSLTPPFIGCIVMWCRVSQFYLSVTRKIASQLPLTTTTTTITTIRYITLHYTALQLHCTNCITLHHTTLHYTRLHYTTLPYPTLHYITLHSLHHNKCNCENTTLITLHHNYNSTTLQLQLHYTTLRVRWPTSWPLQPLQPPQVHSSNHLSVHQWIRSAIVDSQQPTSPIGFLFLKLPPPPCAVLLVQFTSIKLYHIISYCVELYYIT